MVHRRTGDTLDESARGYNHITAKGGQIFEELEPIKLLSTLYKLISNVINNRFRRVLPKIIHQDQKGFVDGQYMGEVTRTIYDAIDDAQLPTPTEKKA